MTCAFMDGDLEPIANEAYVIEGVGAKVEGTSDGEGKVVIEAPVHVREVKVVFPAKGLAFTMAIGDMDPIDEPSGVRQRLIQLGYMQPPSQHLSEEDAAARDRDGITSFQKAQGLPPTGTLDDATKTKLEEAHGT